MKFIQSKTEDAVCNSKKITIGYLNQNICNLLYKDSDFRNIFSKFNYIHPDGIGVFFARKIFNNKQIISCFNWTDNAENFLEFCQSKNYSIYFLGGKKKIIEGAVKNIKQNYPALNIKGWNNGYVKLNSGIVGKINIQAPNILWVGLGSPKQELWIMENYEKLKCNVIHSVGDVFALFANSKKRGPKFIQKVGLEWLVRLISNPSKYWKRYVIGIPVFCFLIIKEKVSL